MLAWYDREHRDLPWRRADATAWGILVSEIMLQQTPVSRVLPHWQEWMERWPRPADLAAAPTADVLRAWDRLGYPRRALRLVECARAIQERHGGIVPADTEALRALPGIGEYTAAAVGAFAFARRTAVADTNVRRVLVRAVLGARLPSASYTAAERALVNRTLPEERECSVAWNQAVMELGALVCTARTPHCERCPLADHGCAYLAAGRPADVDPPRRVQRFEGTDRQLRGQIMALLRAAEPDSSAPDAHAAPVPRTAIDALDAEDPVRVARCLDSLLADGLAREVPAAEASRAGYALP